MAGKTLNAKNLEALGAQRLAELLIEISTGSAVSKKRLRLELAGALSTQDVAREIYKRLGSLARGRTRITWKKVKGLKTELEALRTSIVTSVAPDDPNEGFDLIWQFLSLADPIFERSTEGARALDAVFEQACTDAGEIAAKARISKTGLAQKVFAVLIDNVNGQYDPLLRAMASALGDEGLAHVKALATQRLEEAKARPRDRKRNSLGSRGHDHSDDPEDDPFEFPARYILQEIADIEGDLDAYIALIPPGSRTSLVGSSDIAQRLLAAGRVQEAMDILDGTAPTTAFLYEWQLGRIESMEALDQPREAQAARWAYFEESLEIRHLRAFLKRLPDFDDMEAERKAFAHVQAYPDFNKALDFFLSWPAPGEAAKLIVNRYREVDGNLYDVLVPAADRLMDDHPLAATILLRSMIDFALDHARTSRYKHAAGHFATCAGLATRITDYAGLPSYSDYDRDLRRRHGQKARFWQQFGSEIRPARSRP